MLPFWAPLEWLAEFLAPKFGTDLPYLRYFLTICFGYPISAIYLGFISRRSPRVAHIYFTIVGLFLLCWNYGSGVVHLFIGIASTLATLHILGPTNQAVSLAFIFNMAYLLVGYYYMNYGTYDINWTMSYCILCLRLIGLAWDYRDGSRPVESLSEYQKNAAIKQLPDPLEAFSFCFMPTSCFAGPQFTWRHYQAFINRTLRPKIILECRSSMQKYLLNPKLHRTLSRLSIGIICLAIHVLSLNYFPMDYMRTKEFLIEHCFFYRLFYMGVFAKMLFMRYLAIWLIGEGACVLLGLGCTGRVRIKYHEVNKKAEEDPKTDAGKSAPVNAAGDGIGSGAQFRKVAVLSSSGLDGFRLPSELSPEDLQAVREGRATVIEEQHTRCANISIVRYELATNTDLVISSFNINTNKWMLEYVYKRLRFLGNKTLSHICTLTFLAVWHGFYSGYYVTFLLEFLTVYAEKEFLTIVRRSIYADFLYGTVAGKIFTTIIGKLHVFFLLSNPMVAFALLRASLWIPVYNSVYWIGFIYLLWPLAKPLVKLLFPSKDTNPPATATTFT
ncbi:hypothetical protein Aperf_G00000020012 [Anoplocephala perfoliata]